MRITNSLGLPDPIIKAIEADPYSPGEADITVTKLISPPRKVALLAKHGHAVTRDASDMIFALFGQAFHVIMERADQQAVTEERLSIKRGGWTISGQFDRLVVSNGHLCDYKLTSCSTVMHGPRDEWVAQLNILAAILREHGYHVNRLSVVYFLRDWRSPAAKMPDYPAAAAGCMDIPMWDEIDVEWYISNAIARHQAARRTLPLCSDDERWMRAPQYAVIKRGYSRAIKVFSRESDALDFCEQKRAAADDRFKKAMENKRRKSEPTKDEYVVEVRRGAPIRCMYYCEVADFCDQWQKEKGLYGIDEQGDHDGESDSGSRAEGDASGQGCGEDGPGGEGQGQGDDVR